MCRYVTSRDLPDVLSLRDLSKWSGIASTDLRASLDDPHPQAGRPPEPDGVLDGQPFWAVTTVLRWRPYGATR